MPPIAPSRDMTSARAVGMYMRPATASSSLYSQSHQSHGFCRDFFRNDFALEKFRRLRQLQEAAALSPQDFVGAYHKGKFKVLGIYYPKAVQELWHEAGEKLNKHDSNQKALLEQQQQAGKRQRAQTVANRVRPATTESKPMSLLLRTTSLSAAPSPIKSPFSDSPSLSLSEQSVVLGRRLKITGLPLQSPPPTRPLPAPPVSPQSLKNSAGITCATEQLASLGDSYTRSTVRPTSSRSQHTVRDSGQGLSLPSPDVDSYTRSSRYLDRTSLPDDGWLHPCERDIVIDDSTSMERRDSTRRRGEEEGWKGMASKAVTLVKGKNKGKLDPFANAATSVGLQRWGQGSYY